MNKKMAFFTDRIDMERKKIFFNKMQRETMFYRANKTVVCAGRGTGKGLLHAAFNLENFQLMPRSTTAFVVPYARRALTNTLPSMFQHWEAWGYKEGVHWVVGRKPPRKLEWPDPLIKPESYENIGQVAQFGHHPLHHGMLITSDMPSTKKGSWFLEYEKDADAETLGCIRALVAEIWALKGRLPDNPNLKYKIRDAEKYLNQLRKGATFFGRYSSLCNLEVLGEAWFAQMKRDLPPMEFRTSILCLPIDIVQDGFYSSMKPGHRYNATDFHYLDSLGYSADKAGEDCRMDADLIPTLPLCIAFDFNSNINCMAVGQADETNRRLNVVKSFFVKYGRKLPDLVDDFCQYYSMWKNKEVVFYFDTTALGSNYAVNTEDFRWVVIHQLELHGWRVTPIHIGRPMGHLEKQLLINRGFDGRARLMPMFNEQNNESLLVSIQTAGVYNGHKDKRLEKTPETEESKLEERTDFSDAFDTLYIGCERFPQQAVSLAVTSDW